MIVHIIHQLKFSQHGIPGFVEIGHLMAIIIPDQCLKNGITHTNINKQR